MQGQHQQKRDARPESSPCFVPHSKKKRKGSGVSYIGTSNITTLCGHCLEGIGEGRESSYFPLFEDGKVSRQLYNAVDTI